MTIKWFTADLNAYPASADTGASTQTQERDHEAIKRTVQILKALVSRVVEQI